MKKVSKIKVQEIVLPFLEATVYSELMGSIKAEILQDYDVILTKFHKKVRLIGKDQNGNLNKAVERINQFVGDKGGEIKHISVPLN